MARDEGEDDHPLQQDETIDIPSVLQCRELREDLENMKKAHRLIVQDISSIRSAFKALVQEAQEANPLCNTMAAAGVTSRCSSEYSTESEDGTTLSDDEVNSYAQHRPRKFRPSVSESNTKRNHPRPMVPNSSQLRHLARRQSQDPSSPHHHQPPTRDRSYSFAVEYSDQLSHLRIGHLKIAERNGGLSTRRHSTLPRHFVAMDRNNDERIQKEEPLTHFRKPNVAPHSRSIQRRKSEIPKSVQHPGAGLGTAALHLDKLRRGSLRVEVNNLPVLHEHMHMKSSRKNEC